MGLLSTHTPTPASTRPDPAGTAGLKSSSKSSHVSVAELTGRYGVSATCMIHRGAMLRPESANPRLRHHLPRDETGHARSTTPPGATTTGGRSEPEAVPDTALRSAIGGHAIRGRISAAKLSEMACSPRHIDMSKTSGIDVDERLPACVATPSGESGPSDPDFCWGAPNHRFETNQVRVLRDRSQPALMPVPVNPSPQALDDRRSARARIEVHHLDVAPLNDALSPDENMTTRQPPDLPSSQVRLRSSATSVRLHDRDGS
jgi:hypothetical protein